jgi:hypothetical protein
MITFYSEGFTVLTPNLVTYYWVVVVVPILLQLCIFPIFFLKRLHSSNMMFNKEHINGTTIYLSGFTALT